MPQIKILKVIRQKQVTIPSSYLDFLSSEGLQLALLADGEGIHHDLGAGGDGDLEVVAILLNLRNALDVLALLDQVIRETFKMESVGH